MKNLIPARMVYTATDARMPTFPKPMGIVSEDEVNKSMLGIAGYFRKYSGDQGEKVFRVYFTKFVFCEVWNLINVIVQIFFVDCFLGGKC